MIFNMVGGGAGGAGGGATLVVSSPANVSVTVSKDDKSYTKNSGSLGSTTFKGLATGTWTVTISGNGQTATRTIEITADYAITIAFFSASINITYPANSTCVVTNPSGQTVASDTNTGSSTKTWTATVNATGTYTVTATATDGSTNTKSESVEITSEGQIESVELSYTFWLYKDGEEYTETTGGWALATIGSQSHGESLTKNAESMTFETSFVGGSYFAYGFLRANNKIDVTDFSTIKAFLLGVNIGANLPIYLCASINDSYMASDSTLGYMKSSVSVTNDGEIMLDVTALTGKYYIGFAAGAGETDVSSTITVERVGCE